LEDSNGMQCAVNQCREINLVATLGSLRRNQWLGPCSLYPGDFKVAVRLIWLKITANDPQPAFIWMQLSAKPFFYVHSSFV
jgi:hypothetical protein